MKDKIRSLLGIEMSLKGWEFKPFILLLGILLFIALSIPLLLIYTYVYVKSTLLSNWNKITKADKYNKYIGVKRV